MSPSTLQRFAVYVLLFLVIPLTCAALWLRPDLNPEAWYPATCKLLAVFALVSAAAFAVAQNGSRTWVTRVRKLEDYVNAFPAAAPDLADDGPPELQRLARALRLMTAHMQQVLDRVNTEASTRSTILSCLAEGILAVDEQMNVIFCNDAFAEAFSARTPVPEGAPLYEVVREPALREVLQRVLDTGRAETNRFQLPTAAGRWFESRALPLRREPRAGAVIAFHDVTDLHHQEQVRKDFVADVSHELRTPLAAISGYAQTLLEGALDDPDYSRKFVGIIAAHANRMSNIAADLLTLSELDSGKSVPVSAEAIRVSDVVQSAIQTVASAAAAKRVSIVQSGCSEAVVSGVRFRLEQVLSNLVDNALKFNREGGEIRISCERSETQVRISVADTGIGIPSSDLRRVFERFYRVDKARSRPVGGTGLGLPIVKELVERMNGRLEVESLLGQGSTFTVWLNAADS